MSSSIDEVKQLRDETGVSVMQCKKALDEAEGDMEQARVIVQRKSKEAANKKSDRELGSGVIQAYIHSTNAVGAMVELSCETDFVAKNAEFRQLAYDIAMHIAANDPQYLKKEDISEEERAKVAQALESELEGTPGDKREEIMDGKLRSYFKEQILLEQSYVKNPEKTIGNLLEEAVQKFGENTDLTRFTRFSLE